MEPITREKNKKKKTHKVGPGRTFDYLTEEIPTHSYEMGIHGTGKTNPDLWSNDLGTQCTNANKHSKTKKTKLNSY